LTVKTALPDTLERMRALHELRDRETRGTSEYQRLSEEILVLAKTYGALVDIRRDIERLKRH
jgi:hypothetical protein